MKLTLDNLLQEPGRNDLLCPYRVLDLVPGFDGVHEQYVQQAFLSLIDISELDWLEIPKPDDGLGSWTPQQALAILTYGPRSYLNVELIVGMVDGDSKARCISHSCIHCRAVLGVQIDPRAKPRARGSKASAKA